MNKQETLEEVAENFWVNDNSMTDNDRIPYVNGFIEGAKWQQERMYSEEEVLEFGKYLLEMSNVLMAEKTDVKMLNLEVVKKLVKDLFDLFKKK
jgi:hypothetical protein